MMMMMTTQLLPSCKRRHNASNSSSESRVETSRIASQVAVMIRAEAHKRR
jgi:hypothetical protein